MLFIKSKVQAYIYNRKIEREDFMERLLKTIRMHKIATTAVISAIIFVSIDVVLITNFIHILSLV